MKGPEMAFAARIVDATIIEPDGGNPGELRLEFDDGQGLIYTFADLADLKQQVFQRLPPDISALADIAILTGIADKSVLQSATLVNHLKALHTIDPGGTQLLTRR